MILIGITGKARSGKDTMARMLYNDFGFTTMAFADPLKRAASAMFGLSHDHLYGNLKEEVLPYWGKSPREILQLLGTEAVKPLFGKDIWCKRWELAYNVIKDTDNVAVTDVRFDEEAEFLRARGAVIVEIRRGVGLVGSTGDHASELGLSSLPDYVINNNGTIEQLGEQVEVLMRSLSK